MSKRARISKNGIELALPGYDVDTAPLGKMMISPNFSTMRIALTGYVTVAPYDGPGNDVHQRARVTFPQSFGTTPLVFVAGVYDATTTDQTPFTYTYVGDGGGAWIDCHYTIYTYPSFFDLYVFQPENLHGAWPFIPSTWKYFVFANTMG